MLMIANNADCCGCASCIQACPAHCIKMQIDKEGFEYPYIDKNKCMNCGACERSCPILSGTAAKSTQAVPCFSAPKAIGGWIKNDSIRYSSSSGGAFSLLALSILRQGGIVYGAAMDGRLKVGHVGVDAEEELERLRGSKYVQSQIGNAYIEVKNHLGKGRKVLFSGTPCQAAGLHCFLGGKQYEDLYLVDFICHGVPSPAVFESYMEYMADKLQDRITSFKFRMKDRKWNPTGLQLGTGTGTGTGRFIRHFPGFMDPYMNGFLADLYLRPSCYQCAFKTLPKHYADITIADFWGVEKMYPKLYDGKGTSLVLLNTVHGEDFFRTAESGFFCREVDFQKAVSRNQSLVKSAACHAGRENFFADYRKKPFKKVLCKYMNPFAWGFYKIRGMIAKICFKGREGI